MSISGLCQVCEVAEARHTCERCGAHVCDEHYDGPTGLCSRCVHGARM